MRFWRLPFLLAAFPLIACSADDCNGKAPYDCAVALVQQGRFPAAIELLEKLTAESPGNLRVLNALGIALGASGRLEDANARFRQVLQADPAFLPALSNLAINEFALGHADRARQAMETVLKTSPNDEVAHLYLGEIAFDSKQYDEAVAHYEKAHAKVYPLILHFAECLLHTGRKDELAAVLGAIPEEDTEKQFQAGLLLGNAEAYLEAAPYFARARAHASDPYTAAYDQILMLIRGGDYSGAIQRSSEFFAAGLRRAELYNLISEAYLKTAQLEKAYGVLRTAIELEPEAEDNYADFASICLDNGNSETGLQVVGSGLKRLPDSYRLHMDRGLLLAQQGLTEESEKDFETASRVSPAESAPYVALGYAWIQSGDAAKAVNVLRTRLKTYPNDSLLSYMLGIALVRSGAETGGEARTAFESSIRLNPRFARAHAELGKMLLKGEDVAAGIGHLETAVKLDPEDSTAAYLLGQAYRRKGDTARAQEMLDRVVKLRHQKDQFDPDAEMKRMIRPPSGTGEHSIAK